MANVTSYREDVLFCFCVGCFWLVSLRRKERFFVPMLSPSDIRPAVREVLLSTGNSLASYQILERLPAELRDQIIAERGMPGAGQGSRYTAASLVTDAVEGLLPSTDAPYRVYLEMGDMTFEVAGQIIKPGNTTIAFYRLSVSESTPSTVTSSSPINAVSASGTTKQEIDPKTKAKGYVGCAGAFIIFALVNDPSVQEWFHSLWRPQQAITTSVSPRAKAVSTQPKAAPTPKTGKGEQLRLAFERSKELADRGDYEEAIEELRNVKTLAPEKITAQIAKVRQTGAASLIREVKQMGHTYPPTALDALNRAVALGSTEAPRLVRSFQREVETQNKVAKREEAEAEAKQGVEEYVGRAVNLSGVLGESVTDFSNQFADVKSDPSVLRDNDWRLKTAGRLATIKLTCEQVRGLNVPKECRDAQRKLLMIAKGTEAYGDKMGEAIDTVDVNTINSAVRRLNQATETIPSFRQEIGALKHKYQIQ